MSEATAKPTLASDIAAFKHKHPLDSKRQRKLMDVSPTSYIYEDHVTFEIFHFSAPEIGEIIFDVRGIKDALVARKLAFQMFETELEADLVEHVRKNNGVEAGRMKALTATDLERPCIAVLWGNGYTSFIDGNNRMVRLWDDGFRTLRFAMLAINEALLPFMCEPGNEDQFLERDRPANVTSLGVTRLGLVPGKE